MPAKIPPAEDWFSEHLKQVERRLKALETRPTTTVWNPAAGTPAGAVPVLTSGQQADGTWSLKMWDGSGNTRIVVGQMPTSGVGSAYAGDYGVLLANKDGTTQELLPAVATSHYANLSVAGGGFSVPAGAPSVAATLGQAGDAYVTALCLIQIPALGAGLAGFAAVALFIDGSEALGDFIEMGCTTTPAAGFPAFQASCEATVQVSDIGGALAPGKHTFSLQYAGAAGAGVTTLFGNNFLQVTPI